ncbi:ion transporter [Pedobacter alpinus]|uniref:Ion transporter n=1 Tax=Pedobacter alpinus TaxID=1590643 RepID=A0ABW5TQC7_9SPHI
MLNQTTKEKINRIVFGTDTKAGRRFDIVLLWLILFSVLAVVAESMPELGMQFPDTFFYIDWVFTIVFSIEYLVRIYAAEKRKKYVFSYWGVIDFLSIIPAYISIFVAGYHYLLVIRVLRLLRIFRILKLIRFTREGQVLLTALRLSMYKISVFIAFIFTFIVLVGTLMYVIEAGNPGFSTIPASIYWGIVTVTTVGFGDIVPYTRLGQMVASAMMLAGYAIIAVPTGIVTAELTKKAYEKNTKQCEKCDQEVKADDCYCSNCGHKIESKV